MNFIDKLINEIVNNKNLQKLLIAIFLIVVTALNGIFTVDQRQHAIILQFGEPIKTIKNPGIKFKIPFMQNVVFFDNRINDLSLAEQEIIASDQKRLIVNAFAKYKITDPLKFYTTVQSFIGLDAKLSAIFDSNIRKIVGSIPLNVLLSEDRRNIMDQIKIQLAEQSAIFGIEIIDVRIMRGDLPKENSDAIFARMQTARSKEAKEIRAKGIEESMKIKAEADFKQKVILSEASKKANIIRGVGEGEANKIYANSFGRDPEFAEFYRAMQAYKKSLSNNNTKMVISPDNQFFKHFNNN